MDNRSIGVFDSGLGGLTVSYYWGCSAGAAISLGLAAIFAVTFSMRKVCG